MASDGESVGCFARLFGGGGDKKSVTVDLSRNSEVTRRGEKSQVQSILAKTSGVSIRQTLHFASIATHVTNNGGQPVHILVTGVTASIQCAAPAPAAGPVVVDAPEPPAVVAEERVAVDVHQEEIHHDEVEPAAVEVAEPAEPECDIPASEDVAADAAGDVEVCQEGDQVVPDQPVLEEGAAEVAEVPEGESVEVPSEDAPEAEVEGQQQIVAYEEIVVCEDNQVVFSEPPMSLEEDVIQVEEVVANEQEPEMALPEEGDVSVAVEGEVSAEAVAEGETAAEPEKKKKKKKTSEAEEGGEVTEKKKKKKV